MFFYRGEIEALKKAGIFRKRVVADYSLKDFASNDYLGLAHNKELHQMSCEMIFELEVHASKASMLVNGYHQIHKDFENRLCMANGFEDGIVMGSGFNANIALIEALVRKSDKLFLDEHYHASGILASRLNNIDVSSFEHNSADQLEKFLKNSKAKRNIVAIEGIYSMGGDLCNKEIFEICDRYNAILIVDEAHSSGVVGDELLGVFDHFNIEIKPNYIKMGTLGKAYGSFGAYILSSKHISEFLINRAKPLIYATSLSLYDTILAHNSFNYIQQNREFFLDEIAQRKKILSLKLGYNVESLIGIVPVGDNEKVMQIKQNLRDNGFEVGAIREPTVKSAILRVIARVAQSTEDLKKLLDMVV